MAAHWCGLSNYNSRFPKAKQQAICRSITDAMGERNYVDEQGKVKAISYVTKIL